MDPGLLLVVLPRRERVEDLVRALAAGGIKGALVLAATTMEDVLGANVPIFAGLRALLHGGETEAALVLLHGDGPTLARAAEIARGACEFDRPGGGLALNIAASRVPVLPSRTSEVAAVRATATAG
jgi:hypothetical protein